MFFFLFYMIKAILIINEKISLHFFLYHCSKKVYTHEYGIPNPSQAPRKEDPFYQILPKLSRKISLSNKVYLIDYIQYMK